MHDKAIKLAELLMDVECDLRNLQLWESDVPPEDMLVSNEPFAIDKLTFPQWLQFIFLPRLHSMLELNAPLPNQCGVAPMAEQYFQGLDLPAAGIVAHLQDIDELLSA